MDTRSDWRTCKIAESNLVTQNSLWFTYDRDENGRMVHYEYTIDPTEEERLEGERWLEEEDRLYMDQMTIKANIRQLPLDVDAMNHILSFVYVTPTKVSISQEELKELIRSGEW